MEFDGNMDRKTAEAKAERAVRLEAKEGKS
jgi:hypothetical protein